VGVIEAHKPNHYLSEIFRLADYIPEEIAMHTTRFTEQQFIAVLKSVEAGNGVKNVCREAGISEASYNEWRAKCGDMEACDIIDMKELEDENRRLKQMFTDLSLENRSLREVIEKIFKTGDEA
jgi:putative transposase